MRLFFKKKEENKNSSDNISNSIADWNSNEENKIPKLLPDTLMQRLSVSQNSKEEVIVPQKIFTDDIKTILKTRYQVKDEHKKIPEDIHRETKYKNPEKHEMEKVILLKDTKTKEIQEEQPLQVSPSVQETQSIQLAQVDILPEKTQKVQDKIPKEHHHSFFEELEKLFEHKHGIKHALSQDMMVRMKEYHETLGKGESFFMHEMDIEKEIENSLASLKDIESEWLLTKRGVASAERILFAKEEELERKLGEFKNLLISADRFKNFNALSPEGNAFLLSNGVRLYSIQHLINELPNMSDDVFYMHVTSEKNDFSSWIKDVFKLDDLALRLLSVRTKQEILEILKKY
jgi:hypothetical protein